MEVDRESANLDLLRSMAVLFVLGFHLFLFFHENHYIERTEVLKFHLWQIGHWGVLVFFVHTCLVLMFSLERQQDRAPGASLFQSFMIQRAFRILPLSIFIVLLAGALHIPGTVKDGRFIQ